MYDKNAQFNLEPQKHLENIDLVNWYRFFFIIKAALAAKPEKVLEIGEGSGVVRRVLEPFVKKYETMDVNAKLNPTHKNDGRNFMPALKEQYDCVIAADILEHIPFEDLPKALDNFYAYLKPRGIALITIPHRSHYFLWMTSLDHKPHIARTPTLKKLTGRKVAIDLDHQWEIGDGHHTIKDVGIAMKKAGFKIEKLKKLIYVDFWTLRK